MISSAGPRFVGSASLPPACLLALALILAQPLSCLAWLEGAHVTLDQAVLHARAVERGDLHHHGAGGGKGPATEGVYFDSSTPDLRPTAAVAELPPDSLKGVLLARSAALGVFGAGYLVVLALVLERQHFPSVPHRPPIFRP